MADHVSFTQLNMILKCGEQFRRRYVQGEIIPPTASLTRGKCGHRALEKNFRQKVETDADLPREEVVQTFVDAWEQEKYGIGYTEEELAGASPSVVEGKFKDSGVALVGKYHEDQAPLIHPVLVEEKFRVNFHGDFPPLDGVFDRITREGFIEDDKFVSKSPAADDAIFDVQLTCYDLGYRVKFGKPPAGLAKRYAVATKTPKTEVRECLPRKQEQIDRFLFRLERAMEAMRTGLFLPAAAGSWWCSRKFCGYYETCKVRP
jgi:hypothetical protein